MPPKLSNEEIEQKLKTLPGWEPEDGAIRKQFAFGAFMDAVGFVNRVARKAEAADHHPDITINYRKVTMKLSTHSEGGLTEKDFDLARDIEQAVRR